MLTDFLSHGVITHNHSVLEKRYTKPTEKCAAISILGVFRFQALNSLLLHTSPH